MTTRTVWAGRYAVFDEIASGGMASVYLACRLGSGDSPRVVAVKKLFEQFAKQPEFVTMFLDEAHVAARIRHPNVVTTYEFLRVPDSLAIVMDFVLGVSLLDLARLGRDRGLIAPIGVTVAILADVLSGLHAAHEAEDDRGQPFGLVHRDVSPHNVLVGRDGSARVIDFGIAKAAGRLQVTEVGVMKGKFAYMAPEQIRAGAVDRRVDVYSTGIVLWEALTGRQLFRGSGDAEMFSRRGTGEVTVPAPSTENPNVSAELDAVVQVALEVDPMYRFPTARAMRLALQAAADTASPEEVAAWVEQLAASKLRDLEALRNEVETSYASGELADLAPPHSASSDGIPAASPERVSSANLELDVPDLAPRSVPRPAPSAPAAAKPNPPPARVLAPDTGGFGAPFDGAGPGVSLDLAASPWTAPAPSQPRLSSSSLDARASATFGEATRRRSSRQRSGFGTVAFLLVFLGGSAAALWSFGPAFLKRTVIDAATRRGLALTIDHVEPRSGGLMLVGVTGSLIGMNQATMKASEVEITLDWQGNVVDARVPGYELEIQGSVGEVGAQVTAWRKLPHGASAFHAKAGHLTWTNALLPGVTFESIDVSMTMGAAGEGSFQLELPSVSVTLPSGGLGPWRAVVESNNDETKLNVALDRAHPDGPPRLTFVSRPTLGSVLSVSIPRTRVEQVGVPADFLHVGSDPEIDLVLDGQVMPTGEPVTSHVKLGVFGVAFPTSAVPGAPSTPLDLAIDASVSGDTAHPLPLESGTLVLGKVKSKLTGQVTFAPDGILVELERPPSKTRALPPFVLDTRDWSKPRAATSPKPAPSERAPTPPARHDGPDRR